MQAESKDHLPWSSRFYPQNARKAQYTQTDKCNTSFKQTGRQKAHDYFIICTKRLLQNPILIYGKIPGDSKDITDTST